MADNEVTPLVLHLDDMPAAVYAELMDAMADGCNVAVLDILDNYVDGGLKERHWIYFEMAVAVARTTFQDAVASVNEAQEATQTAAAWGDVLTTPRATWEP